MRTTVTLDPDVEVLLKNAQRERGGPFKQVLDDAVREGLRPARSHRRKRFVQPTARMGRPRVDLTKALALAGELEDQAILAKIGAGR